MSLSKMPKDKIIRNMPLSKYEQGGGGNPLSKHYRMKEKRSVDPEKKNKLF